MAECSKIEAGSRIQAPFVLLEQGLTDGLHAFLFQDPQEVLCCWSEDEVEPALARLMEAQREGLYAAGFFSYELGYLFEPKLAALLPRRRSQPLLWMGLYREPKRLPQQDFGPWLEARHDGGYELSDVSLSWDEARYRAAFDAVKDYICAGDVYQINLTLKYKFNFSGNPFVLYSELRHKQRTSYAALIGTEGFSLLSLSPELFLDVEHGQARTRPMKGTAPRGLTPAQDAELHEWLRNDPKSRAENLMIVDLLRNDLGRASVIGSVSVTDLFSIERYPTVHQMTSGIQAQLLPGTDLRDLLAALFPCGSITGAPKVRAMEIIRELEPEARGAYTGAVGMIAPDGKLAFNVAIRSLWIDAQGCGEMGIGSGVVFDSVAEDEYQECLLKTSFLTQPHRPFDLIETLRWQSNEYYLLDRHLARLERSARHFLYPFEREAVVEALNGEAADFTEDCYRVRLTLSIEGQIAVTSAPIELPTHATIYRFAVSGKRIDSTDPLYYHKTTQRALYDNEFQRLGRETGCDEVLFLNERDELTEGSRTNLFVQRDGVLLTPPLEAGVLDGTFRRELLDAAERPIRETKLYREDLDRAEAVYFGNSVRGLVRAEMIAK